MTTEEQERPKVEEYRDYRAFLKDMFDYWKKMKPKVFSFQYCANKIGTNKSYLKHVMEKNRHIRAEKIPLLSELFRLDEYEERMLLILFYYDTHEEGPVKDLYYKLLVEQAGVKRYYKNWVVFGESKLSTAPFMGWLPMAISALARLPDFEADPEWIWKRLGGIQVEKAEISKALEALIDSGTLVVKDGKYVDSGQYQSARIDPMYSKSGHYYRPGIEKTYQVLDDIEKFPPYRFDMLTIAVSSKEFERVLDVLARAHEEIKQIEKECEEPSDIFFFSNNMFCLTPPVKKKDT